MKPEEVETRNAVLDEVGKALFNGSATLRIVRPCEVVLRATNARYMKKGVFQQLVSNLEADGRLSSVPLCRELADGRLQVLSGNHRIQAAMRADLEWALVMILLGDIEESAAVAIQLSHNSLAGEDDKQILADLWARVDSIADRLYAGLSSDVVGELEEIKLVNFSTPQPLTKTVTFAFTTSEADRLEQIIQELEACQAGREIYLGEIKQFSEFFDVLQRIKGKENIKNASLAMARLVDLAERALREESS